MPLSMREHPDPPPAPATRDGEVVVEARTARQALEAVHERVGPHAAIVEAVKVRRGGLAGFFARELVQIRARADGDTTTTSTADVDDSLERLLADLSEEAAAQEHTFADALRRELDTRLESPPARGTEPPPDSRAEATPDPGADPPPDPGAEPAPDPGAGPTPQRGTWAANPEPASTPPAIPAAYGRAAQALPTAYAPGTPDWSVASLHRLGLPPALVEALDGTDPSADLDCLQRLAEAVRPLCRHLPDGPAILGGPRADRLGRGLGLAIVRLGEDAPATGPFAVRMRDRLRDRGWLAWNRNRRWFHVVVGGAGSWALAFDDPKAVSWVGEDALPEALRLAVDLHVPLGYGLRGRRHELPLSANPVEVALAVRDLLPRR